MRSCFAVVLIALLLAGCGAEPPPPPDYTRLQLVEDLFGALTRGESEAALRSLDRLRSVTSEDAFYRSVQKNESLRLAMRQVLRKALDGKAVAAQEQIRSLVRRYPRHEGLAKLSRQAEALAVFETIAPKPLPEWSDDQQKRLDTIAPYVETLQDAPTFQPWYHGQKERLAALKRQERLEQRRQLTLELDHALIVEPKRAPLLLALLAVDAPSAERAVTAAASSSNAAGGSDDVDPPRPEEGVFATFFLTPVDVLTIAGTTQLRTSQPWFGVSVGGLSGELAEAFSALYKGRFADGLSAFRNLRGKVSVSEHHERVFRSAFWRVAKSVLERDFPGCWGAVSTGFERCR